MMIEIALGRAAGVLATDAIRNRAKACETGGTDEN